MKKLSFVSIIVSVIAQTATAQVSSCAVFPSPNDRVTNSHLEYLPCWGRIDWLSRHEKEKAPEQCDYYNGYITMFEDNFDGNSIDTKKWHFSADGRWYNNANPKETDCFQPNNTPNYQVNNGVLTMKSIYVGAHPYPHYSDNCPPTLSFLDDKYYYTTGQINTFKLFPTGRYELRCKAHYTNPSMQDNINMAPMWLFMPQYGNNINGEPRFWNEIDIELWDQGSSNGKFNSILWTYHASPPFRRRDGKHCFDGNNNHCILNTLYNDWHTFVIEWDSHKIKWSVDGNHFRSIYRTYNLAGLPINECTGPAAAGYKRKNDMFPTYTNMQIFSSLGTLKPHGASEYVMEIDYIKALKKIDCNKDLHISEFKAFDHLNQNPPTYGSGVQTPQVLTGGVITVAGGNEQVTIKRGHAYWIPAHLDLYASSSVTLLPGFLADPSADLYNINCPSDVMGQANADNCMKYGGGFLAQAVPCPKTGGGNKFLNGNENLQEKDELIQRLSKEEMYELEFYEEQADLFTGGTEKKKEEFLTGIDSTMLENPNLEVYPNPLKSGQAVYFVYTLPQDGETELSVSDLSGHKITTVEKGHKAAAVYSLIWKNDELASGSYIVNLKSNGYSVSQILIII